MYTKRLQIDAGVNIMRALSCLDHFIAHYLDSHVGRNHPVVYGGNPDYQTVVIYQTDKSFIVRKG
jgi:hypothetical protein